MDGHACTDRRNQNQNQIFHVKGKLYFHVRSNFFNENVTSSNKQIQRIYVPPPRFFLRNKESSENVKFIRGVTLTRYILSTYVDSNNA